ncbi:GGDEF domain-containing protein [Butyrivibrio fibrisolvens]|uniref:GGDEF domain-containing protein n=1 Tax=Butyrivibrio fibrisolvens TaxID=831 RepID=UPI0004204216|nr:GGDEF domain-containing protein [Butyrivibrio fibrisolvens]
MSRIKRYYVEINSNCQVLKCSDDFLVYIGRKELLNIESIIKDSDINNLKAAVSSLEKGDNTLVAFRTVCQDGRLNWMSANVHRSKHDASIIKLDIYDLHSFEMDKAEGYYDEMTGLLSKSAITDYAKRLMEQTNTPPFYFFLMDIDNFKSINDTYGHMKGDEVIVEVAGILKKCVGDKGAVGRIGGDEFLMILEKIHTEPELRDVLRNIRYDVREKYADEDNNYTITTSLGGALFPTDASNYEDMFKLADKMLYIAKAKGRDRYIIYTPSVHGDAKVDTEVVTITQRAMQNRIKNALIMDLMEGFLLNNKISLKEAFNKVIDTYMLDAVYLVDKKTGHSCFGLSQNGEDTAIDLSGLDPSDYQPIFETYPIKVINMYDLQKDNYLKFSEFMLLNGFRIIVVYYMRNVPDGGYLMYVSNVNSNCRFSETDFSDLIYFSRMLELSGKMQTGGTFAE